MELDYLAPFLAQIGDPETYDNVVVCCHCLLLLFVVVVGASTRRGEEEKTGDGVRLPGSVPGPDRGPREDQSSAGIHTQGGLSGGSQTEAHR